MIYCRSDRSRSRSSRSETCRYEMVYRVCTIQIQPRKHVLDHADWTAPPGNMSQIIQIIQIIQIRNLSALKDLDHHLWQSIICPTCGTIPMMKNNVKHNWDRDYILGGSPIEGDASHTIMGPKVPPPVVTSPPVATENWFIRGTDRPGNGGAPTGVPVTVAARYLSFASQTIN